MKIRLQLLMAFLIMLCFCNNALSQSGKSKQPPLRQVNYSENIHTPLTSDEIQKIKEVYGDHMQKIVLENPQLLKDIKHILRNRVEFREVKKGEAQKPSILLSQVGLFNVYVPELKRDLSFDPKTFNPLKYNFNFYSRGGEMYKIDNSDYLVIIKSQYE